MNCIYRSFKADPRNENRRNIAVSPVVVGHHIEISNRFLNDLRLLFGCAKSLNKMGFIDGEVESLIIA